MKKLLLVSILLSTVAVQAKTASVPLEYQIKSITIEEVGLNQVVDERRERRERRDNREDREDFYKEFGYVPDTEEKPDRLETAGRIIGAAGDLVALGEKIYELANKGRPKITTAYEPISIVPKDPTTKEIVDPFELEGFSMPVQRNFVARVKNGTGKEVVTFNYKVIYSYGGSYNGVGKYISAIQIVPGAINVKWGWEFNSTMKLAGIMNHGSKASPVAGAMVAVKYSMSNMFSAFERNDTIHVTGNGELKTFAQ